MSYTHLTEGERNQISALRRNEFPISAIAKTLNRSPSTISRELRRNRGGSGYRPKQAHRLASERASQNRTHRRITSEDWKRVERLLRMDWSPEQVSLWLKKEGRLSISHEWIYQHIYADQHSGGTLHRHLRVRKPYKKRYGIRDRRGKLRGRVSIDERPATVEARTRLGDWELDTVYGKGYRHLLVSLVERTSRLALVAKIPTRKAALVKEAVLKLLTPLRAHVHTITSDNGKEFAEHQAIANDLKADFYFAHPHAAWERGLNEQTNGLLRQYFPKRRDFSTITEGELGHVMDRLNNRPRKCLGMKTPNQVFFGIPPPVALRS